MKATLSGTLSGRDYSGVTSMQFSAESSRDEIILKQLLDYYSELSAMADSAPYAGTNFISLAGFVPAENCSSEFNEIMLVIEGTLTEQEMRRAAGCLGYALREVLAGEDLSEPVVRQSKHMAQLAFYYDSTKSRRDDPDFTNAFDKAARYINEGTPVRTTNRAGSGTKGTRLVEGIGERRVDIYVK